MDLTRNAQEILSDPKFDVEGFVKQINIHYQNTGIAAALGGNAAIVLSLIEAGDYRFLEIQPDFINPDIFKQLQEEGYEVYAKYQKATSSWRRDSWWYGVKISENLGINYRRLGHSNTYTNTFNVLNSKEAVVAGMDRWKRLGLTKAGEGYKPKPKLPVYAIRLGLWDFMKKEFNLNKGWGHTNPSNSQYYVSEWDRSQSYRLQFQLLQSGKDHVRVKVECPPHEALISHNGKSKTKWGRTTVSFGEKFKVDDPNLYLKIFDWVTKSTSKNNSMLKWSKYGLLEDKVNDLKLKAGLNV